MRLAGMLRRPFLACQAAFHSTRLLLRAGMLQEALYACGRLQQPPYFARDRHCSMLSCTCVRCRCITAPVVVQGGCK